MKWYLAGAAVSLVLGMAFTTSSIAADDRELVEMPSMMQDHMLANMRDHLKALNEIFAAMGKGDTATATTIAEQRLGMSSHSAHGSEHMAPFMPEPMKAYGSEMHRAASRFVLAAQDAEVVSSPESQAEIYEALTAITDQCVACHQDYRIR